MAASRVWVETAPRQVHFERINIDARIKPVLIDIADLDQQARIKEGYASVQAVLSEHLLIWIPANL